MIVAVKISCFHTFQASSKRQLLVTQLWNVPVGFFLPLQSEQVQWLLDFYAFGVQEVSQTPTSDLIPGDFHLTSATPEWRNREPVRYPTLSRATTTVTQTSSRSELFDMQVSCILFDTLRFYLWGRAVFPTIKQNMKRCAFISNTHVPLLRHGVCRRDRCCLLLTERTLMSRLRWRGFNALSVVLIRKQNECCSDVGEAGADWAWQSPDRFELLSSLLKAFVAWSSEQFFPAFSSLSYFIPNKVSHYNQSQEPKVEKDADLFCSEINLTGMFAGTFQPNSPHICW